MKFINIISHLAKAAFVTAFVFLCAISTASAQTQSTITIDGTDYTLYTGFTATSGTSGVLSNCDYPYLVDGDISTYWFVSESNFLFVEFFSGIPIIPKGYVYNTYNTYTRSKAKTLVLKAKIDPEDEWTVIASHSGSRIPVTGKEYSSACSNDDNMPYKYFRLEVSDNEDGDYRLTEIRLYGSKDTYTLLTQKASTCQKSGIKQNCYYRNDGKFFADNSGSHELQSSEVFDPKIDHSPQHHPETDYTIEYWQCTMCNKYFSDANCNHHVSYQELVKSFFGTLTEDPDGQCSHYTLQSKTYTLTDNVNTSGYIYVPAGVTATIDLNGYTIDRKLTSAVHNGMVIKVAGNLTIKDNGTEGTIKGGYDEIGNPISCVEVQDNASLTIQGGMFVGRYDKSSAVYSRGSVNITGGKITNDNIGVNADAGSFAITGGEISGNSDGVKARARCAITISGNPVISGNTQYNLALLEAESRITINGKLTEDATIGIAFPKIIKRECPITFTSGYGTYHQKEPFNTYFSLDHNEIGIEKVPIVVRWNDTKTDFALYTIPLSLEYNFITVADIPDQPFTGAEIEPEITIKDGEATLVKGTDYTVEYSGNTNTGTATATIAGIGNYIGERKVSFSIVPKVTTLGTLTLSEDQNGITAEIGGDYNGSDVAYSLENDIENVSVIFNRTFTAGVTSTIVLPFDIEAGGYSGGDFYEFSDIDTKTWTATMSKVTSVKAHTPYLFVPSGESLTISQKVTLEAASSTTAATTAQNGWTFTGVYQKKVWNGNDGGNKDYCFAANSTSDGVNPGDFVKIGTYVQVRAFRCYLTNSTLAKSKTDLPEKITIRLIDETSSVVNPDDPDPLNPEDSGDITTPVSEITPNNGTKVWSYDRTIFIEAQSSTDYQIIDLSGRMLLSGTTNSTREEITLNRTVGIVIVKIGGKTFKVNY